MNVQAAEHHLVRVLQVSHRERIQAALITVKKMYTQDSLIC